MLSAPIAALRLFGGPNELLHADFMMLVKVDDADWVLPHREEIRKTIPSGPGKFRVLTAWKMIRA